ncbi:MAG TPA: oligosaccharide flippase family protein [Bacteroidia bacterium]|jgi:O-antigen/teichoic acid export membrane protein|nr:oligosaccharide flippase family protein [Bacteroidia bacterium]
MKSFLKRRLDPESRRLFRNSAWVFFSNMFSTGLAFVRSVVIARGLGAGIFGTFTMVTAFVGLIQEFLNLNIGTALIRQGAIFHAEQRNDKLVALVKVSLWLSAAMAALSVVVVAGLAFFSYSTFFELPDLHWFIVAYAVAASVTYLNSISRGLLRLYYKFRATSVIQMIMDVVETISITIAVLVYPKDLRIFFFAVIVARFLNGFIINALAFWELRRELGPNWNLSVRLTRQELAEFRKFVLGNSIGNSLKTMINQGDVLLLGALSSAVQVGFYSVSKKLAYSVLILTDPLVSSIYPQLSKLLAERKFAETRRMLFRITSITVLPAILFLTAMAFLNRWVIVTLYGAEYAPAAASFFYFLIASVVGVMTFWSIPLIQSLGLVGLRIKVYVVTILGGSLLAWWLIGQWQATGMAIALLSTNLFSLAYFLWAADRKIRSQESESASLQL